MVISFGELNATQSPCALDSSLRSLKQAFRAIVYFKMTGIWPFILIGTYVFPFNQMLPTRYCHH
jgi:hypothetical protein